jgi:hypothetical protein
MWVLNTRRTINTHHGPSSNHHESLRTVTALLSAFYTLLCTELKKSFARGQRAFINAVAEYES